MKDRPTPETDANAGFAVTDKGLNYSQELYIERNNIGPFVHAAFSRKLERERDELRETLEEWRFHKEAWGTDPHEVRKHIAAITKERDELRAEVERLKADSAMLDFILKNVNGTREELIETMKAMKGDA